MTGRTQKGLLRLRKNIDSIDRTLLNALARRMKISSQMGIIKKKAGIPVVQNTRWKQVMATRLHLARRLRLDPIFVERVLKEIHKASIKTQRKIYSGKKR